MKVTLQNTFIGACWGLFVLIFMFNVVIVFVVSFIVCSFFVDSIDRPRLVLILQSIPNYPYNIN